MAAEASDVARARTAEPERHARRVVLGAAAERGEEGPSSRRAKRGERTLLGETAAAGPPSPTPPEQGRLASREQVVAEETWGEDGLPAPSPPDDLLPIQRSPLQEVLFGAEYPSVEESERPASDVARRATPRERAVFGASDRQTGATRSGPQRIASTPSEGAVWREVPVTQVSVVERVPDEATAGTPVSDTAATGAEEPGVPQEMGGPDLDRLAEEVYRRIRERLRIERERYGRLRHR